MASPAHSAMSDRPWVNTLISRGCSCRHAIVLKGHEKINLQCKCHIIETEHEANSGKPRKHIRSRKDGRYAGMANSGIPSCCLALLDQVSSKTPGPPAMWNFRPCSRTLHTHTHTHTRTHARTHMHAPTIAHSRTHTHTHTHTHSQKQTHTQTQGAFAPG